MSDTCFARKTAARLLLSAFLLMGLAACGGGQGQIGETPEDSRLSSAPVQQGFGLPSPQQIMKGLSFTNEDLIVMGEDNSALPAPQNTSESGTDMLFNPDFPADGGAQLSGLAFAVYGFRLNGYTDDILLHSSWQESPGNLDNVYIGLSHWQSNRWVWHRPDAGGLVSAGPSAPLISTSASNPDLFAVAVVVTGSAQHRLDWLRVGGDLPPMAVIEADTTFGDAPLSVTFDASDSSDPENEGLTFEWDLDGDSIYELQTGSDPSAQFTYETPGIYVATVNVLDQDAFNNTASIQIEVGDSGANILHPPTDVSASDGTSTTFIALSWTAPSIGIVPEGYEVYRRPDSSQNFSLIGTTVNTNLQDNAVPDVDELQHYKVVSIHSQHADSADSIPDEGFIGLGQVINFQASDSLFTDRVRLTWSAPADGATPGGYRIMRGDAEEAITEVIATVNGDVFQYDDMDVIQNQFYWYQAIAVRDTYPDGLPSLAAQGRSSSLLNGLMPPRNLDVLGGPGFKQLNWMHPIEGPEPAGYKIYRSSSQNGNYQLIESVNYPQTSWQDLTPPPGTQWYKLKSYKPTYNDSDFSNADSG